MLTTTGISWDFSNTSQFNLSTPTWTNSGTNVLTVDKDGAEVDWDISNDLTLNNMTYTGGTGGTSSSTGGVLNLDNVIDIALVNSDIISSIDWQNLTNLNIDSDSTINANSKGCLGGKSAREAGYGPNPGDSYKCASGQASAGQGGHDAGSGGGYGGNGGDGSYRSDTYGTTYVYEATPIYLGSGGSGGASGNGGNGGGSIRIDVSDTITIDGNISSDGQTPTSGQGGGGSGGSVYISTINLAGSAYIDADGGDGEDGGWDGGGGGGGRIAIYYAMLDGFNLVNITSDGGATPGGSEAGDDGTVYPVLIMQYSSGAYKDTDANGQVDRVDITFNKAATVDECEAGDYTFGGADAGTITVASCATDGNDLQLTISNAPSNDTSLGLTWAYTAANGVADSINDGAGYYLPDVTAQLLSDAAAPVALSGEYLDVDVDGDIDRVDVTFTEQVSMDECEPGDFTFTGADAGSFAVSICTIPNDEDLRFTVTGGPSADTYLDFGLSYTAANGAAGSIDDTNNVASADFSIASLSDGAAPMLYSVSPVNGETDVGLTDDVVLSFTEPINTGSFAYNFSEAPSGITLAWTGSNSIATVSHTGSFDGMTDITFTVTAAPDVAANAFAGGMSGITHPFTFTTQSAGSSGYTAPSLPSAYIPYVPDNDGDENSEDSEGVEDSDTSDSVDWSESQVDYIPEVVGTAASPVTGEQEDVYLIEPGMFIKGQNIDTVYYIDNNLVRRPFYNSQIFFTWVDSFDVIIEVTDATLSTLSLGQPILPKAGVVLVKIQSDPKVYALEENPDDPHSPILRWVQDEATAIALYGEGWADYIIDIDVTLFSKFSINLEVINDAGDLNVDPAVIKKREELAE